MTTKSNRMLGGIALCAMLSVVGCTSNGNSNSGPNGGPQQPPMQPNTYNPSGPTQRGMSAPVLLNLRGPSTPAGGNITLDLEIVVNAPVQAPVTLQVQVPPGVTLVSGQYTEMLSLPQPGKLYRQYVVYSQGPLAQPVLVTAQAQGPNNAWGFSAKQQYPPASNALPPYPRKAPAGRPPAMPIR